MPTVNGQPYPANRWRESGGTVLTAAAVTDGQFLKRSGSTITSAAAASAGTGSIAQEVVASTTSVATGTTAIPDDDTIPQNTEGTEFLTCSITPQNSGSTLLVRVTLVLAASGGASHMIIALFRDSTANSVGACAHKSASANVDSVASLQVPVSAGSTSATTFKVRVGNNDANTITLNGTGGARKLGGVCTSSMTITEILP